MNVTELRGAIAQARAMIEAEIKAEAESLAALAESQQRPVVADSTKEIVPQALLVGVTIFGEFFVDIKRIADALESDPNRGAA